MKTIIVWFRNDLRVHDHPALWHAAEEADYVVPVFILDQHLLSGPHASSNRNRFLLESLVDLKQSLRDRGGDLFIRHGEAVNELQELITETKADGVYYTADYSPYALKRDKKIKEMLVAEFRAFPGRLIASNVETIKTKAGTVHKVFTPFYKNWLDIGRRDIAHTPQNIKLPPGVAIGTLPELKAITQIDDLSPQVIKGGEREGRLRLKNFLDGPIEEYQARHNNLSIDGTSRLSAYFHFGCLSPREVENMLPQGSGADAWHRQLAWRDFYHYMLFHFPTNSKLEFQERYRDMQWLEDDAGLKAWQNGQTGFPVVDAAMRQLKNEGWMHNRGRLIVGSFLTKDLQLDWRHGESYFMRMLIDGDQANNNGNWQWIASVGVDPAPVFRRMYNPSSQQKNYDPQAVYVRKYVPELRDVPDKYITEPWKMPLEVQKQAGCLIGQDYPEPIVDHKAAREASLERYRQHAVRPA